MTERLAQIRARLAAATPGPWHVAAKGLGNKHENPTVYHAGDDLNYIATCADFGTQHGPTRNAENAEFIAHAPDDIAWLVAEVERLDNMVSMACAETEPMTCGNKNKSQT